MEGLTHVAQRTSLRIVALLILLELLSVSFVWTLNPISGQGEATFALFLALDLVTFAMISYVYRVNRRGDDVNRVAILAGCCFGLVLLFAGLLL